MDNDFQVVAHGMRPESPVGMRFERSIWCWRALWDYCETNFPDLDYTVDYMWMDGHERLSRKHTRRIADRLIADLESGAAQTYTDSRVIIASALAASDCDLCDGTGVRTDEVGHDLMLDEHELLPEIAMATGRTHGWCNGCYGEGKMSAWETMYKLTVDDIRDFAVFLEYCGGFKV